MDKKWLNINNKADQVYIKGVDGFLEWAYSQPRVNGMIRCPCKLCVNTKFKHRNKVRRDLLKKGFWESYTVWDMHGELRSVQDKKIVAKVEDCSSNKKDISDINVKKFNESIDSLYAWVYFIFLMVAVGFWSWSLLLSSMVARRNHI